MRRLTIAGFEFPSLLSTMKIFTTLLLAFANSACSLETLNISIIFPLNFHDQLFLWFELMFLDNLVILKAIINRSDLIVSFYQNNSEDPSPWWSYS